MVNTLPQSRRLRLLRRQSKHFLLALCVSDNFRIFFETHFNTLLNSESPRLKRKLELERRLAQIQLPAYLKHKIRRSLEKNESDALRRTRLIAQRGRHTVKVGAYEIVKILGKFPTLSYSIYSMAGSTC